MKKRDLKIVNNVIDKISILQTNPKRELAVEARLYYDSLNDEQKSHVSNYELLVTVENEIKRLDESPNVKIDKINAIAIDEQIKATNYLITKTEYDINIMDESIRLCELLIYNNSYIKNLSLYNQTKEYLNNLKIEIENKKIAKELDDKILSIKNVDVEVEELLLSIKNEAIDDIKKYMKHYDMLEEYLYIISCIKKAFEFDERIKKYDNVTLDDEEDIFNIFNEINNSSNDVKKYIKCLDKLNDLIEQINYLNKEKSDRLLANQIDKQIILLDKSINDEMSSFESKMTLYELTKSLIEGANKDCLNLVTNMNLFMKIKNDFIDIVKSHDELLNANKVVEKINSINTIINIDEIDDIIEARNMYEALNDREKKLVINYNLLVNLEESLYENESAYMVVKEINEIKEATLANESLINDVLCMYNELSDHEKQLVENYNLLLKYQKEIVRLKEKKELINEIIDGINNLTINDVDLINSTRNRINQLNDNIISKITNIKKLDQLEDELSAINEAKVFDNLVNNLPYNLDLDYYDDSIELKNEYDNKSNTVKAYIKEYSKLVDYIKELEKSKNIVDKIIKQINDIEEVMIDEGDDIARIKMSYELLDPHLKKHVKNYELLCAKEREFMRIQRDNVIVKSYLDEQIELLLETSQFLDESKIEELKLKLLHDYSILSDEEKKLVKDIDKIKEL